MEFEYWKKKKKKLTTTIDFSVARHHVLTHSSERSIVFSVVIFSSNLTVYYNIFISF